jgi:mono/diheme cytochrome c family protein
MSARLIQVGTLLLLLTSSASLQTKAQTPGPVQSAAVATDPHRTMLSTYCFTCHNDRAKLGGLSLEGLNLQTPAENAQIWEKALRKLRGRLMPPPGNPQPPQKEIDSFATWMESALDANTKGPRAAFVPIHRMNRTEYAASLKALVGVDVKEKDVLPQDIQVGGFDNNAAALGISPAFLEQYVTAARQTAKTAVGNPLRLASVTYNVAAVQQNDQPLPPGTRGGMRFKHRFPADGEYRISVLGLGLGLYTGVLENESTLVLMVDGKVVFRKPIGGFEDQSLVDKKQAAGRDEIMSRFSKIPVQVGAGEHELIVAFVDRSHVESDENVGAGFRGIGDLGFGAGTNRMTSLGNGIEVVGPYNPTGVTRTPSRDLIFVCDPKTAGEAQARQGEASTNETACARKITENLARRAFRRPVTAQDVDRLMPFYDFGRENNGSFDLGIEQVVMAVLASPEFLYRSIHSAATEVTLTDLELASRLSFFLWNTGPDDQLLTLAAAGGLTKPGALDKQVTRMMADPKASSLVTSFALKWLNIADLDAVKPDPALFQEFTEPLRRDFSLEARQFLSSILLEGRSVVDLLNADYTFLNERLARHYGIPGVYGSQFRKVVLTGNERRGLLGKGAVLLRTSYGDRTSPVLRGAWVLDKLMGTPPSPPPPNTATDLSVKAGEKPTTIRARLEQHRQQKVCMQCHGVIDPSGLPLENFDAIGRWRTTDRQAENAAIDARSVLPNGVAINGPGELATQLASRPSVFAEALTEKLMVYALNRDLEYFDMPQVRAVVRAAAKDNYRLSSIVRGIVNTDAFRKQGAESAKLR